MKRLKKIALKTLKVIAVLLGLLLVIGAIIYFKAVNYKVPDMYPQELVRLSKEKNFDSKALAHHLVGEMSLEEKVNQLSGQNKIGGGIRLLINYSIEKRFPHVFIGENERLHIPPWVLSDGPRGARVLDKDVVGVTTFPVGMARGASWDTDLEYDIHQIIASEIRANRANYAATPCVNLLRHPAWGRAQETYGEDPWHMGEFGVAAVKAIESQNVMACPKHFALNSIENSRWVLDVSVDDRSLHEVYLPHFKKIVQEGKPASMMSAYNAVNGEYSGQNKTLLTDILRDDWGFDGFVSTDWGYGIYDGATAVKAGLDVEMPFHDHYGLEHIEEAIEQGKITEADIDTLVVRSLATRLKYAMINDQDQFPKSIIAKKSSIDLARRASEESMVLVKNENVLPFSKEKNKTVAIIGRLANVDNTGDHGSSDSRPPYVINPYEGIKAYHDALGNEVVLNDGSDLGTAAKLAEEADDVILIVGYDVENEGEYAVMGREPMLESAEAGKEIEKSFIGGGDRLDLRLLAQDEQLIENLVERNKNIVVVYIGGSAIDLSQWDAKVPAILFSWYAGMEGGHALANILYGETNPSGKLPFSIAKKQEDYPYFKAFTTEIDYGYYHGYTLFDKMNISPAYPFGHGLSYSHFGYANLTVQDSVLTKTDTLSVNVEVTNESSRMGKEVVQLYVGFNNSEVDRPVKLLRDFKKVTLRPGETKKVMLNVEIEDLAWYNPKTNAWEVEAMEYELYVGGSSAQKQLLTSSFSVN